MKLSPAALQTHREELHPQPLSQDLIKTSSSDVRFEVSRTRPAGSAVPQSADFKSLWGVGLMSEYVVTL